MANPIYRELAQEFDRLSALCKNAAAYTGGGGADSWLPQVEKEIAALTLHLEQAEIQMSKIAGAAQQLGITAAQKQREAALKFGEIREVLRRCLVRVQEELS